MKDVKGNKVIVKADLSKIDSINTMNNSKDLKVFIATACIFLIVAAITFGLVYKYSKVEEISTNKKVIYISKNYELSYSNKNSIIKYYCKNECLFGQLNNTYLVIRDDGIKVVNKITRKTENITDIQEYKLTEYGINVSSFKYNNTRLFVVENEDGLEIQENVFDYTNGLANIKIDETFIKYNLALITKDNSKCIYDFMDNKVLVEDSTNIKDIIKDKKYLTIVDAEDKYYIYNENYNLVYSGTDYNKNYVSIYEDCFYVVEKKKDYERVLKYDSTGTVVKESSFYNKILRLINNYAIVSTQLNNLRLINVENMKKVKTFMPWEDKYSLVNEDIKIDNDIITIVLIGHSDSECKTSECKFVINYNILDDSLNYSSIN